MDYFVYGGGVNQKRRIKIEYDIECTSTTCDRCKHKLKDIRTVYCDLFGLTPLVSHGRDWKRKPECLAAEVSDGR